MKRIGNAVVYGLITVAIARPTRTQITPKTHPID